RQVAEAFGSDQSYVSRWERLVAEHGWHTLSDRYRHQLQSLLPNAAIQPGDSQNLGARVLAQCLGRARTLDSNPGPSEPGGSAG
ncbi:MAG TPA: hypothetical protein VF478_01540, partial [Anaerolineae bacterium]